MEIAGYQIRWDPIFRLHAMLAWITSCYNNQLDCWNSESEKISGHPDDHELTIEKTETMNMNYLIMDREWAEFFFLIDGQVNKKNIRMNKSSY